MMFGWPLMSLTSLTGPRLMPMRILQARTAGVFLAGDGVAQVHAGEQRILGVAEKADRGAVAGVEDDAIVACDACERLASAAH